MKIFGFSLNKLIIGLLLLIIIILAVVLLVRDDPGVLLLRYRTFSIETSLAFGLFVLIVSVVGLNILIRFSSGIWRFPKLIKQRVLDKRQEKSRRQLSQGLIDMAEGRFSQAEKNLMRTVRSSDSPILHYLAAARAAQLQGKHDARDGYLKAAHESTPEAEIAIGVTQAELQLAHQQTEQALATLTHLRGIAPKHDYVLMLLGRAFFELKDWSALTKLLPDLRRKKLLEPARLEEMELAGFRGDLDRAALVDQAEFEKAWNQVPKRVQSESALMFHYLTIMTDHDWNSGSAGKIIVSGLERQWDDHLIEIYGQFEAKDVNAQLKRTEKWLAEFGHNEHLLLALGRISMRARLWGKAQGYLEASISERPTQAACLALAELFEQELQQEDKAAELYKRGLKLVVSAET